MTRNTSHSSLSSRFRPAAGQSGKRPVAAVEVVEVVAVVVVISGESRPVVPIRTLSQWVSATAAVDDGEKCETEKGCR